MDGNKVNEKASIETYFAPAARASDDELRHDVEVISKNPVIDAVLNIVAGLVAVLNEHRQVLAINNTLLKALGIDAADELLGLRPGEVLNCIHSHEHPGGCGTSRVCSTCGAVIAIVASLATATPELRECTITIERNNKYVDLHFQVRCYPITFEEQRFLLLFLQDITIQQQQAALERAFFHDINNTIAALILNSQVLDVRDDENKTSILTKRVKQLASQLGREIEIQKALSYSESHIYQITPQTVSVEEMLQEMREIFANHPVSKSKSLDCAKPVSGIHLVTDTALLRRILTNMLVNAFEATEPEDEVRLWLEQSDNTVTFCVWNRQAIPEDVALRVFQRNFSTKAESGRGLGTYAMRLFSETYLGGKMSFATSKENGTVFRLCLPGRHSENC